MTYCLYTIGYEKRNLDEFIELLSAAEIGVLIDVRETAWSHKPGFSKSRLSSALLDAGIHYVHARFAGNPKALRVTARNHADCLDKYERLLETQPEIVAQFEQLVDSVAAAGISVAITCFERHPEDCHRNVLAKAWERNSAFRSVEHIAPLGCARLITS